MVRLRNTVRDSIQYIRYLKKLQNYKTTTVKGLECEMHRIGMHVAKITLDGTVRHTV